MKNINFTQALAALVLTATAATIAPSAIAAESKAVDDIQKTRLEFLNNQSKTVNDIQKTRLEFLNNQSKTVDNVQKNRLEFLNNQSKVVADVPAENDGDMTARSEIVFEF